MGDKAGAAVRGPDSRLAAALFSTLLIAVDAAALDVLRPRPARLLAGLAQPQRWVDTIGVDEAVAQLAAALVWLLAAWLALGVLAGLAGRLPGAVGTAGRRLAAATLPAVLQRALAGAAGLGVLLNPVAAIASTPPPGPPPASTAAGPPAVGTSLPAAELPTPELPSGTVPAPDLPLSSRPLAAPATPAPTAAPVTAGRTAHRGVTRAPRTVVVRPGDSLWRIAARRLPGRPSPARIAAAWPRWYAANRAVVGPDPDLLIPGEILHAPEETSR